MEQGAGWSHPVILPKPPGFSRGGGLGINDHGDVAGSVSIAFQDERAVLWERVGSGWNVTRVTPGNESDSHANDVSNSGQVVGAISHSFTQRPFLWREGRLQLLGAGGTAMEINDNGRFTGMGMEYRHAMVWVIQ